MDVLVAIPQAQAQSAASILAWCLGGKTMVSASGGILVRMPDARSMSELMWAMQTLRIKTELL